jgi:drug/metabolite transporter (DMT)-like permease
MATATLLAFGSAALHAGWNLLLKRSEARVLTAWGFYLAGGVIFLPVFLFQLPDAETIPYIATSSFVHVAYILALSSAYDHGDLSFSYPLARGGGALLAAVGGVVFLSDHLHGLEWLAISIVVLGLASLVRPGSDRAALLFAGLTALAIGTYTTLDAAGARKAGDDTWSAFAYGAALVLGTGVAMSIVGGAMGQGGAFVRAVRADWRTFLAGGLMSTLAYSMVLAAYRLGPVGYGAALRESSVVIGAAAGWLLLHERMGKARLASAAVIAAGLVLLVIAR